MAQPCAADRLIGVAGRLFERAAVADSVELYPGIMEKLGSWTAKLGVAMPEPP